MLDGDGTPLSRRYFCSKDEKELDAAEIVRGYQLDGKYVVVTDEELEALEPDRSRDIDMRRFVDRDSIDPMDFESGYVLTPAGGSSKAYRLLAQTMESESRAGIATFVMRGKEYLVAILAEDGVLRAETMRFQDEIRSLEGIEMPAKPRVQRAELSRIEKAIRALSADELAPRELQDAYTRRALELVEKKQKARQDVVEAPEETEAEGEEDVIDLMEIIKRSMRPGPKRAQKRA